jgi:sterol O-acyltransferase
MLTMVFFMKMYSYQRMNSIYAKIGQENNELRKTYRINYPANLTVSNFTDFLCIPVIVYQCEYPRNDRTRPTILVTRFAQFIILLNTCALLISDYIIPTAQQLSVLTYYQVFWKLSLPLYCFFIILFLIVWEVILGFFAELTK